MRHGFVWGMQLFKPEKKFQFKLGFKMYFVSDVVLFG